MPEIESVADWQHKLLIVYAAAEVLRGLPLDKMIQMADQAQTIGPLLHPTLWIEAGKAASEDLQVLRAARTFAAVLPSPESGAAIRTGGGA